MLKRKWWSVMMLAAVMPASAVEWPLSTAGAESVSLPVERVFDAVVEPVHRSTVSAQTSGSIVEINYDVDDVVPKGAVLLRIHDVAQRAALQQAKANVLEAKAREKEAKEEHQRVENLVAKNLASRADLDRAVADLAAAQAATEAAQAGMAQAEEQLAYTVVSAPYAGIVLERHVELGETVQPGSPLMTGFSLERLRMVASVSQDIVQQVRQLQRASVELRHLGRAIESEDVTVFPVAQARSHTFQVRVVLPPGVEGIYPGMLGKVRFVVDEVSRLLVPVAAVVQRSDVTGVYVVDTDSRSVVFRRVVTGRPYDDRVEVLAGLDAGEQVALDPVAAGIYLKETRQQR